MIDELRELRKEYKLQNDFATTTIDATSTYNPDRSETLRKKKASESYISTDISRARMKSRTQMTKDKYKASQLDSVINS
jgi:hypothetical protein